MMPRNGSQKSPAHCCNHTRLSFSPAAHATEAGYHRPTVQQRLAATTTQGREPRTIDHEASDSSTFPAPLILPGDDLSLDPKHPPQSVRAWARGRDRNKVMAERRTIYVVAAPDVDPEVAFICSWSEPSVSLKGCPAPIASPSVQEVVKYLSAFYYGLAVKILAPSPALRFTSWDEKPSSSLKRRGKTRRNAKAADAEAPEFIGLTTSTETVRIRTRAGLARPFRRQVNLDDLLDVAMDLLPDDAYALLLLVEHDLFEDEDDDFACGRAYGGSRVAVVSTARYHPGLDVEQDVERDHAWPASHCEDYLRSCSMAAEESRSLPTRPKKGRVEKKQGEADALPEAALSPLLAAVAAHNASPSFHSSSSALAGLWIGRVCKTASHELGHCFGIDHCVYYACVMQGTASLAEDARQPPYLCPVDEAKLASALGGGEQERMAKMIEFCEGEGNEDTHLFRAFAAWLRGRTGA